MDEYWTCALSPLATVIFCLVTMGTSKSQDRVAASQYTEVVGMLLGLICSGQCLHDSLGGEAVVRLLRLSPASLSLSIGSEWMAVLMPSISRPKGS